MKNLLITLGVIVTLYGCNSASDKGASSQVPAQQPNKAAAKTAIALREPIKSGLVELPSDALVVWRRHAQSRPTLILFANDPLLQPVPKSLNGIVRELFATGTDEELFEKVGTRSADPVMMPLMAVSVALETQLFSRVIWVLPAAPEEQQISLATFRQQLLDHGAITPQEAATFTLSEDKTFVGEVRGTPFVATYPSKLSKPEGTAVVHLDLSFFSPFYQNEIKTPIFPIVYSALDALRKTSWPLLDVTISTSNADRTLPVDTRFLGRVVNRLFLDPTLLDQALPENWERRKNILYLENLFQPEKILELAKAMVKSTPNDADAEFALYQAYRDNKDGSAAVEHLSLAVKFDRGYAMEYLALAQLAKEKRRPDQVVRMLELAASAFPENPFFSLDLARAYLANNERQKALHLLTRLQNLAWSEIYYPTMHRDLAEYSQQVASSKDMLRQ